MARLGRGAARKFTVQPKVVISSTVTSSVANSTGQAPDGSAQTVESPPPAIMTVTTAAIVRSHYW